MFVGAATRLITSPIFELNTITLNHNYFSIIPCLTANVCVWVGWFQGGIFFPVRPLLSSPFVPSPFRVLCNLAASAQSLNHLGHCSKSQLVNESAARTTFPGKG